MRVWGLNVRRKRLRQRCVASASCKRPLTSPAPEGTDASVAHDPRQA